MQANQKFDNAKAELVRVEAAFKVVREKAEGVVRSAQQALDWANQQFQSALNAAQSKLRSAQDGVDRAQRE